MSTPSVEQIQADIEAARVRLAGTLDELAFRAQPKEILRREIEHAKARFAAATHDEHGELRTERIAAVLAVVAILAIGLGLVRRRRRTSGGGILIPATASVGKRLAWATVVATGNNARQVEVGDRVLFDLEDLHEVELQSKA
jgi:hypothetical protein